MKLLSQARLSLVCCILGLVLLTLGAAVGSVVGLGAAGAGALCLLVAVAGLLGVRAQLREMAQDLQAQQTKP